MISLPNNQPIVEDTNDDAHINQNDIQVTLTFTEHEMINDVLMQASNMMDFACVNFHSYHDLPMENEIIQRYTMIENLRERFNEIWSDRFETND